MAWAPRKPCRHPGCAALTLDRFCPDHARSADQARGSARARGYDGRWEKARAAFLRAHPLCRACEAEGRVAAATVVDHIVPHRGNRALFWDPANWQPLCKLCHDAKTIREGGLR